MKKIVSILLVFFLVVSGCFSATQYKEVRSGALPVVGVVGKVHTASIFPIMGDATSPEGMPFDILGSDVQNTQRPEAGRKIATWSLLTNYYPATLTVAATPLSGVVTQKKLDYRLYITCVYNCVSSAGARLPVNEALTVDTRNGNAGSFIRLNIPEGANPDSFISIIESPIRFTFTESLADLKLAPDDEYLATVRFTVTSD